MKSTTIRCSGVPEHFNLPWKQALKKDLFVKSGIKLVWETAHGGTGAMCNALRQGETDMAIALTEGAISNIQKGLDAKICSFFVDSPLLWGVHAGATSNLSLQELQSKAQFAISRFTSGSHLMAFMYMKNLGVNSGDLKFNTIQHLKGAIESLSEKPNQLFLWEKFTTKPYVTSGKLKRVGEIATPWPAFSVVASNKLLENNVEELKTVLEIVQQEAIELAEDKEHTIELIAKEYNLQPEDTKEWFSSLRWSSSTRAELSALDFVAIILEELGLTEQRALLKDFYHPLQE
jgi:ABC-type nitrate/sulfonate/bicarbonate transport system substrate-binding protein